MGLWPTQANENPVMASHPSLPEGAFDNSPGQTLSRAKAAALGKGVNRSDKPRRGDRSPEDDFRRSEVEADVRFGSSLQPRRPEMKPRTCGRTPILTAGRPCTFLLYPL